ncbi:MAG: tetratricopeptide repeat protein [Acetobacteraceae bacterium]|nr:tetratricopeptide repeat protein [Acetobacteraceae bacterium]
MNLTLPALVGGTAAAALEGIWEAGKALAGTRKAKDWAAGVRTRAAGRLPLPENHDLIRGIRTAHLGAIDKVARRHAALIGTLPSREIGPDDADFAAFLRAWLDERLRLLRGGAIDIAAVTEADVQQVLDEMVHPSSIEGYAAAAARNRRTAEAKALAEIEAAAGRAAPPLFRRLFTGEGAPGWYDVFALFVNEAIKTDERFRSIFLAAELVELKRLIEAMDARIAAAEARGVERLERVEAKLDALPGAVATRVAETLPEALISALRQSGLLRQAEAEGLAERTILAFARRLRPEEAHDLDSAVRAVEHAVEVALDLIRRGERPAANEDAFVGTVLAEVARRTRAGDLDGGARAVDDGLAELAAREAEQRDALRRARAALLEAGIGQEILRRDAEAVARRVEALVALDAPDRPAWALGFRAQWDVYHDEGRDRGLNLSLEIAIALARRMLATAANADERGLAGTFFGGALQTLGERESGTARLEEAVVAHRAALEERARDRVPLAWASTQNDLGNALRALGERESDPARLEEAIGACRAALEERTRDRVPLEWARTQNNLGTALRALGERESDTARLAEAVLAFRAALEVRTRDRLPLEWARTQNNLGTALQALGLREGFTARLEEAVQAYRAALDARTRDRVPLEWARTQGNLGNTLQTLGMRESGTAWLEAAVSAYRAALMEFTRDRAPRDWARTLNNLGNALVVLGSRGNGTIFLEQAMHAYCGALQERTRDRGPFLWALTMENIALAEEALGDKTVDHARWWSALRHVDAALEEYRAAGAAYYIEKATRLRSRLAAKLGTAE